MKNTQFLKRVSVAASTRFFMAILVCLLSLPSLALSASTAAQDAAFQQYANRTLAEMWRKFPEQGVAVGYYKYAQEMTVPDTASRASAVAFYEQQIQALAKFDADRLSAANRVDLVLMRNQFASSRWDVTVFKSWQWQPSQYNVGNDFGLLLNNRARFPMPLIHFLPGPSVSDRHVKQAAVVLLWRVLSRSFERPAYIPDPYNGV